MELSMRTSQGILHLLVQLAEHKDSSIQEAFPGARGSPHLLTKHIRWRSQLLAEDVEPFFKGECLCLPAAVAGLTDVARSYKSCLDYG